MDLVGCGAVVCSGETGTDRVCAANPPRRAATTDAAGRQAPSGIPRPGWGPRNPHRRLSATVFRGFFLGSSALIKGTLHAIAVTQTPKGKDTRKRGQVCCAYWCSRRKGRNNGMAKVPMLFRGHASKSMAAARAKDKRNKRLKSLCRADVVHAEAGVNFHPAARTRSEKAVMQPGRIIGTASCTRVRMARCSHSFAIQ